MIFFFLQNIIDFKHQIFSLPCIPKKEKETSFRLFETNFSDAQTS